MYMGDSTEAIPTPTPAQKRAQMNTLKLGANAMAIDEIANVAAATNNPGRRPYLSARLPAAKHPAMAPNANEPVVNPSPTASSPNWLRKNGNPPVITAKSNPNRYPPIADAS